MSVYCVGGRKKKKNRSSEFPKGQPIKSDYIHSVFEKKSTMNRIKVRTYMCVNSFLYKCVLFSACLFMSRLLCPGHAVTIVLYLVLCLGTINEQRLNVCTRVRNARLNTYVCNPEP